MISSSSENLKKNGIFEIEDILILFLALMVATSITFLILTANMNAKNPQYYRCVKEMKTTFFWPEAEKECGERYLNIKP